MDERLPNVSIFLLVLVGSLQFCETFPNALSGSVMPLTISRFTASAKLITIMLATNAWFGFLVAPYVAWKSDRIWTRFGRRRPFMVGGLVPLMLSMVLIPFAPSIALLFVLVVVYQFCQDFWASGPYQPLCADLIPVQQRGLLGGLQVLLGSCAAYSLNQWGVPLIRDDSHPHPDLIPYLMGAAVMCVALLVILFLIREPYRPPKTTGRFTPFRYVRDIFENRRYGKLYLVQFSQSTMFASFDTLIALYAHHNLGLKPSVFGPILALTNLIMIVGALPLGWLSDYISKRYTCALGFLLVAVPCGIAMFGSGEPKPLFTAMCVIYGVACLLIRVTNFPLMTEYIPRDSYGTIIGAFWFTRAGIRVLVIPLLGVFIDMFDKDYRVPYVVAFVFSLLACLATVWLGEGPYSKKALARQSAQV